MLFYCNLTTQFSRSQAETSQVDVKIPKLTTWLNKCLGPYYCSAEIKIYDCCDFSTVFPNTQRDYCHLMILVYSVNRSLLLVFRYRQRLVHNLSTQPIINTICIIELSDMYYAPPAFLVVFLSYSLSDCLFVYMCFVCLLPLCVH